MLHTTVHLILSSQQKNRSSCIFSNLVEEWRDSYNLRAMASQTRLISVVHANATRHIALYSAMEPSELSDLLCAVFALSRNSVIGFASEVSC